MLNSKLLVIVAVVVLVLVGGFLYTKNSAKNTAPQPVQVVDQQITDASASIGYQINAKYPQIQGLSNTETQNQINAALLKVAQDQIDTFKKTLDQTPPNPNLPPQLANQPSTLTITYQTAQANDKIVSVNFEISTMMVGDAYPTTINKSLTYDVAKNKVIQLPDLFKPDSDYLQKLSQISRSYLVGQLADVPDAEKAFVDEGTTPELKNFQNFTLENDNLVLIFDPYQVAPGAWGTRTVTIPFSDLKSVMVTPN